jgi:hypothetical protein
MKDSWRVGLAIIERVVSFYTCHTGAGRSIRFRNTEAAANYEPSP